MTTITTNCAAQVIPEISLKNVLCATDFSTVSKKALAYAASIARSEAGKLHIIHVLPEQAPSAIPMEPLPASMDREWVDASSSMTALGREPCLADISHEDVIERGPIEDVISDVIDRKQIDLLVLGTHGRGGLNKFLLGSVAEDLFRTTACPVLTVGSQVPDPPAAGAVMRTVLFPTDFGEASLAALPYALSLAKQKKSHLILLHAITPKAMPPQVSWDGISTLSEKRQLENLEATNRLAAMVPPDELPDGVQYLVLFGAAPEVILDAVGRYRPDLVVMGLRKLAEPRAAAHLYWSAAHQLVSRARCPILTIRH